MRDQVHGDAFGSRLAYGHESEHGGAVDDLPVADGGEHAGAALHRGEPDRRGDGEQLAGQVDEVVAVASYGAAGDDRGAAAAERLVAAGEDACEAGQQPVPAGVGEVAAGPVAADVVALADLSVALRARCRW